MSKFNLKNLVCRSGNKPAPRTNRFKGLWGRFKKRLNLRLTQYFKSAKTFNFTFISLDGEFLKYLVYFLIALSIFVLVCHHCGTPPLCLLDKVIELLKVFFQQK